MEDFTHLQLIYYFHRANEVKLKIIPFLDEEERGIFFTRAPLRPNPIAISIVEVFSLNPSRNILNIRGVDMLDSIPLLDIKPYVPLFDSRKANTGWISRSLHESQNDKFSNGRF